MLLVSWWSSIYSISCDIGTIPDELAKCWYTDGLVKWSKRSCDSNGVLFIAYHVIIVRKELIASERLIGQLV